MLRGGGPFSRGLLQAIGSSCDALTLDSVFLPEMNSGKRRNYLYALRALRDFPKTAVFGRESFLEFLRTFFPKKVLKKGSKEKDY